jgi:hypothetical protein
MLLRRSTTGNKLGGAYSVNGRGEEWMRNFSRTRWTEGTTYLGEPRVNGDALLKWKLAETEDESVQWILLTHVRDKYQALVNIEANFWVAKACYEVDQINVEKPGGSSTLLKATYAIVALGTWRDNLDRCAGHVSWTRSVVQYHLCSFPTPPGSLHSVLPPVGYRTQVRCGGQIKSRGSHVC